MKYLIDTDVLVSSKRINYHPDFCQLFWDWVELGHSNGTFFSIDKINGEIAGGDEEDMLRQWSKRSALSQFFLPTKSATAKWADLANWARSRQPKFLPAAVSKFLDAKSADAWLIAYAASEPGWTVVTNEVSAPDSKKDIKLPDAGTALGVITMSLPKLLRLHAKSNFTFAK